MANLLDEVGRFRDWAGSNPPATRSREGPLDHFDGEWECDYPHWPELYDAVIEHLAASTPEAWSDEQRHAVLYTLARDHEGEHLGEEIRLHHPTTLIALANAAQPGGEPDARWQLADQLGHIHHFEGVEALLLAFARDEVEYVRRRALQSLARINSPLVEQLASEAWHRPDDHQEWARMTVLDCLHRIRSPHLDRLLAEAELDERPHLRDFAKNLRKGHSG